ncbi:MAG TPA: Npt1/Npt2 family nucleotide transporter [Patescibacteria group bacterium]|nr:Npt1/Npt2 family nucleotide transporter [Patescibacteria group bacterium]
MLAVKKLFKTLFNIEPHERLKVFYLSVTFFLVIGAYTITRELKSSIFMSIVGREYVPWAKVITMLLLVPLILFYSKLVDSVRRYQLLMWYSTAFGIAGLCFAYFLGDPIIGIPNHDASPYRSLGWLFYFFIEAYSPFVVSVFWAFANSITSPDSARKNYGFVVSGSKLGGMFSAGFAWYLFGISGVGPQAIFSDVVAHQIILCISSCMLLCIPFILMLLIYTVPNKYLHGYEAAYQLDHQKKDPKETSTGMFGGIEMFAKYPYVLGIFLLVFFYELINVVLGYLRLGVAEANATNIADVSKLLFEMMFKTHAIGLVISTLGTRALFERLGTTVCLMLVPLLNGLFLLYLMIQTTPDVLVNAFVLFKAVHYAFSWPLRESLYIPTVKEIKFKARSWIDAFGSKIARTSGSAFNVIVAAVGTQLILPIHSFFFAIVITAWFMVSLLLGRKFEKAIRNNEVIGTQT